MHELSVVCTHGVLLANLPPDLQRLEPARLFGVPADPEALFQRLHDPRGGKSFAVVYRAHAPTKLPHGRRGALSSLRCTVRTLVQCLIRVYKTWYSAVR